MRRCIVWDAAPMRRLEDKIQNLCRLVLATKDDDQLNALLAELRGAIHEHIERIRMRLAEYPIVTEQRDHNAPKQAIAPIQPKDTRARPERALQD